MRHIRLLAAVAAALSLSCAAAAAAGKRPLAAQLTDRLGAAPTRIEPSPVPGWRLAVYGTQVFLVSEDGRWLVNGAVLSLERGEDILEARRRQARLEAIEGFGERNMIVFPAKERRRLLTVFTDVSCPYCRAFHRDVPALNEAGITVRYVPFALAPPGSPRHRLMVSVWCAKNRRAALTAAKSDRPVPERRCDSPVDAGTRLGRLLGFTGTPTLVTDTGEVLRGLVPAAQLVQMLAGKAPARPTPAAARGTR